LLPKHPIAEAVYYALGQWEELNVFCSDAAVPIDNNVSEREMKRVVLNRKNSLFVDIWITFQFPARSFYIVTLSMLALFRSRSMSDYLLVVINDDSADTFCSD
jgi:hypothetical protein